MSTPSFLTWTGSVSASVNPYRPSVNDLGGASFADDADFPPDPNTQLTAAVENQNEMQVAALGRVAPAAIFYVKNSGTPSIYGMRAASDSLQISDITVSDLGVGFTEITCPATKLIQPFMATATAQVSGDYRVSAYVNAGGTGIRVETFSGASGTHADVDFSLIWW